MTNPYLAAALAEQQEMRAAMVAESEGYDALTIPKLADLIDARNADRAEGEHIVPDGKNKPDLVAALEADDALESQ